jgi:response regulator of citrate/malate metabolism
MATMAQKIVSTVVRLGEVGYYMQPIEAHTVCQSLGYFVKY